MNIGFDAKELIKNTPLVWGITAALIVSLAQYFPQHQYYLFAPKITSLFAAENFSNVHAVEPSSFFPSTLFKKRPGAPNW